jgi:hypothetical protein
MRHFLSRLGLAVLGFSIIAGASPARAVTLAVNNISGGSLVTESQNFSNPDVTVGYSFTVGSQPISVGSLGFYDTASDGLATSHMVGVWNTSGTLLASALVPAGTVGTLDGGFRFTSLGTQLALAANTKYYVAGESTSASSDSYPINASFTTDPSITYGNTAWTFNGSNTIPNGFAFPNNDPGVSGNPPELPVNFSIVPEPSSIGLLACGLIGLALARRRDRRA